MTENEFKKFLEDVARLRNKIPEDQVNDYPNLFPKYEKLKYYKKGERFLFEGEVIIAEENFRTIIEFEKKRKSWKQFANRYDSDGNFIHRPGYDNN